jgi:hypothetical protein
VYTPKTTYRNHVLPLKDVTGKIIDDCIILPLYITSKNFSTGAGHGIGSGKDTAFFAHPFVYKKGERFRPQNGKAIGLLSILGGYSWLGSSTDILLYCLFLSWILSQDGFREVRSLQENNKDY